MATYAIGDIQGCYDEFMALLNTIAFDPDQDRLWLCGDLVNRGPKSLEVVRAIRNLGASAQSVLGNHDLHLIALATLPEARTKRKDTLAAVLDAPDCAEIIAWLCQQPVLRHDRSLNTALVHAGLAPQWTIAAALRHAAEVESELRDAKRLPGFLRAMYGDEPSRWDDALSGEARLRVITNCFTRMRYCDRDGTLNLAEKGPPESVAAELLPWFALPTRASCDVTIVFGHWSTLRLAPAAERTHNVYALDTGAVWGGELTALRLEDRARFSVRSRQAARLE